MTLIEILDALRFAPKDRKYPEEAIQAAIAKKEEITPILLKELEDTFDDPDLMKNDQDYMLPYYALFLLAKFREKKAHPVILKLFTLPPDIIDYCFGSFSTDSLHNVLASTFDGNTKALLNFAKDEQNDEWARGGASRAFLTLYANGLLERDSLHRIQLELLETVPYHEEEYLYESMIENAILSIPEGKLSERIDDCLLKYHLEPQFNLNEEYKKSKSKSANQALKELQKDKGFHLVDEIKDFIGGWQCFDGKPKGSSAKVKYDGPLTPIDFEGVESEYLSPVAPIKSEEKVKRNDPCTCGSGKKHKKCCGK